MADAKPPPEAPEGAPPPLSAPGDLLSAWEAFRDGVAPCPVDAGPLALAVDGTTNAYRFVCVRCGVASPWFEAGAGGLRVRAPHAPGPVVTG